MVYKSPADQLKDERPSHMKSNLSPQQIQELYEEKQKIYKEQVFSYDQEVIIRLFARDIITFPTQIFIIELTEEEYYRVLKKMLTNICKVNFYKLQDG